MVIKVQKKALYINESCGFVRESVPICVITKIYRSLKRSKAQLYMLKSTYLCESIGKVVTGFALITNTSFRLALFVA